jgi:hypothetical protein
VEAHGLQEDVRQRCAAEKVAKPLAVEEDTGCASSKRQELPTVARQTENVKNSRKIQATFATASLSSRNGQTEGDVSTGGQKSADVAATEGKSAL